jgi:hypothetical protein
MICPHCGKHIDDVRKKEYSKSNKDKMWSFTMTVKVTASSGLAYLMYNTANEEYWMPKSQMKVAPDVDLDQLTPGDIVDFEIPNWLALDKGLVNDDGDANAPQAYTPESAQEPKSDAPTNPKVKGDDIPF